MNTDEHNLYNGYDMQVFISNALKVPKIYELQTELIKGLVNHNKHDAVNACKELVQLINAACNPNANDLTKNNYLTCLSYIFYSALKQAGVTDKAMFVTFETFLTQVKREMNSEILATLVFECFEQHMEFPFKDAIFLYSSPIKSCIEHINTNLTSKLTVESIASSLHISRSHLSTLFKKETGMTIIEFIHKSRIELAKLYLSNSSYSILTISNQCGFNNVNYFCRIFAKCEGVTPSQYRLNYEKKGQ